MSAAPLSVRPAEILLVEDNRADAMLAMEAFQEGRVLNHVNWVEDGDAAMTFLHKEPPHENVRTPDLIFLDLNLPKKDGRAVLKEVKGDPELRRIPVIIMTTSKAEADVFLAYDGHANAFITKPMDVAQFMSVARQTNEFWLAVVRLPPKEG